MFYFLVRWTSVIFFKLFLWLKVEGGENVPSKGAFIIAANHSSYLDPFLVTACTSRKLHFITRAQILSNTFTGWILKHANTISAKRHGNDLSVIKSSLQALAKGRAVAIFPEGVRSKDRKLKRAKSGVGMIVYMARVPVVPAYIEGTFDALPRRACTFKRHPVRIIIGKPIYFTEEFAVAKTKDTYQGISDQIMRQIDLLKSYRESLKVNR